MKAGQISGYGKRAMVAAAVLAGGIGAEPCRAALFPSSVFNSVSASASSVDEDGNLFDPSESDSVSNFLPYDLSVGVVAVDEGSASASQSGSISSDSITAQGRASSGADASLGFKGSGIGESFYDVRFNLTQASGFTLDVTVFAEFGGPGPSDWASAFVDLVNDDGTIVELSIDAPDDIFDPNTTAEESFSGVLEAGIYTLRAQATSSSSTEFADDIESGRASFAFAFIIPEPTTVSLISLMTLGVMGRRRR